MFHSEAISSNPVEARIFFFGEGRGGGSYLQLRKLQLITNATILSSFKIFTSAVHIIFSSLIRKLINVKTRKKNLVFKGPLGYN